MEERKLASVGVFVVVRAHNRILLVRHAYGTRKWSLPGGGLEQGELIHDAGRRETKEETGLDVQIGRQIGIFSLRKEKGIVILLEGHVIGGTLEVINGNEISDCYYFERNEIPIEETHAAQLSLIAQAYEAHPVPVYDWLIPPLKKP